MLRTSLVLLSRLALALLLCAPGTLCAEDADALELVLLPHNVATFPRPVAGFSCEKLAAAPEEAAKAPEGDLSWGRLRLGETAYLYAVRGSLARTGTLDPSDRLFLDRDRDGDLAEETPLSSEYFPGHMPGYGYSAFDADGLSARLPGAGPGGEALELAVSIRLQPHQTVASFTALCAAVPGFSGSLQVSWMPGSDLLLQDRPHGLEAAAAFRGPGRLRLPAPDALSFRDGAPVCTLRWETKEDLAAMTVPPGTVLLTAQQQLGPVPLTYVAPVDGQARMPAGRWTLRMALRRKDGDRSWTLAVERRNATVSDGGSFGPVEPLTGSISVRTAEDALFFTPAWKDASGQDVVRVSCQGVRLDGPAFDLETPEGDVALTYTFVPRYNRFEPFRWERPEELRGVRLRVKPRFPETPFATKLVETEVGP